MSEDFISIAHWLKAREAANKRSGSVLISLMGDFIVPHGGAVALGSLVEAGALTGISEQTIRSSVNRLVADGWLTTEAMGRRSICRFSESGHKRFNISANRIYQNANDQWSGEWHIVVANQSSQEPDQYQQHVRDLQWSGFGKASDNVFLRPKLSEGSVCCDGELHEAIQRSMVCFFGRTAPCLPKESISDLIQRAWDMPSLVSRYQVFVDRYEGLLAALWKNPRLPGVEAFAIRTFLIHDFRRIRLLDPQLPLELLPDNWIGSRALYVAHELYDLLMPSSEQYVMEFMQGPDGRIPYVESFFYDRFGGLTRQ